ncbi:MAG: bifunctional diaminohydroxyphosphoribosylaminopyrimidine deaminase/5-amino-6-(5-phosphoribosylamino)uracil reductase RibD [bacterium]
MDTSSLHEKYMRRCLELARKGTGRTGSNPLVGSVIVHEGKIIGEGFHREYGGPHAEVNAINSVKNKDLLSGSTIYVNMEPCAHYGKTPPCSLLIRESKIPEVVISMIDPHSEVSGKGIKILERAGINVTTGILEKESRFLNRRFLVNQLLERPYIILKWAQSKDGFIDKIRAPGDPVQPNWITNQTCRMLVHKWRSEEAGIIAGVNTILTDNPALNVRNWSGKNPVRVVIDRGDKIPGHYKIKDDSEKTLIFTQSRRKFQGKNTEFITLPHDYSLREFLKKLLKEGIHSLIVEGGLTFFNQFIDNDLWDEARIFTGDINFKNGVKAPEIEENAIFFDIFRNNKLEIKVKSIC